MTSSISVLCEDWLRCSMCLDVFTDPVSTPCGHNFCKICLKVSWDRRSRFQCPLCRTKFPKRPDLRVNTVISELAIQCKKSNMKYRNSEDHLLAKTKKVLCDSCTEEKLEAVKSCLHCGLSFCNSHLMPHKTTHKLMKHKLMEPLKNLENYICQKHERPLELFCRDDQMCVCLFCIEGEHKNHNTVPIEQEIEDNKSELEKTQAEVQQMIQDRLKKIEEIKDCVKLNKENTEKDKADVVEVISDLMCCLERSQTELCKTMEQNQKTAENQAEEIIKVLEEENIDLNRRKTELEQIIHSKDHLHILQIYPSLYRNPHTQDWTDFTINSYVETLRRALFQIQETFKKKIGKIDEIELKRIQQYAGLITSRSVLDTLVDVTPDPDTAHYKLILSDDVKRVYCGHTKQNLPDNPKIGRFYYEVQVRGKTKWALGVAQESFNRQWEITDIPEHGCWCLWPKNINEALDSPSVPLSLKHSPQKVGVFVDYKEGLISFYDVDAKAHIYSFTGQTFTEKLYPYFSRGNNDEG